MKRLFQFLSWLWCTYGLFGSLYAQADMERRRQYLAQALRINEPAEHRHPISRRVTRLDSTWRQWQERTGELPPDFETMPSTPYLPEPLRDTAGREITTPAAWNSRKTWIREAFQHWVSGKMPPPPSRFTPVVLSKTRENGATLERIQLQFGPGGKARMTFELMIPDGKGPFPVYMTQWTHRNWAQLALRRGYIGCVYAGADGMDDTQAYQELYPDYDFTGLMRRAWGASRVVDYLYTRPEVNKKQIAITGHSRNGKQSLWAGAFDERFTAVISSSCGTGGVTPFRFTDPQYGTQTIDDITSNASHWFHPRLRFFFGHEDRLPVDQNLLLSLIAPRNLLLHYSIVERQLNPWATEQCFRSVQKVYRFLGAPEGIAVLPRLGEHAVATRDLEQCLDYLDMAFGRRKLTWHNELYYPAPGQQPSRVSRPFTTGLRLSGTPADTASGIREEIQRRLRWLLGDAPPRVKPLETLPTLPARMDWIDLITGRPSVKNAKVLHFGPYTAIGDHLSANLYLPEAGTPGKRPVVIFLHEFTYAHGYAAGYKRTPGRGNELIFQNLVDQGYAVLAFDLPGFGSRILENKDFYKRFPHWSVMGRMVEDARSCIDALETMENIDSGKIYLYGNSVGGQVALLTAALDPRVAGVITLGAFSPWRTSNERFPSIRTLAREHNLLPRLGLYSPEEVPLDYGEIFAAIAPRPVLVVAPLYDRHTDVPATAGLMQQVAHHYALRKSAGACRFETPGELNRTTPEVLKMVGEFLPSPPNPGTE